MKKGLVVSLFGTAVLAIVALSIIFLWKNLSGIGTTPTAADTVKLDKPSAEEIVKSPLTIEGSARGLWFFEASFPIRILDANGKEIGASHAEALGEWMTTEFVPFRGTVEFQTPTTNTGTLVLEKDNPSGLPENAAEVRYSIKFR